MKQANTEKHLIINNYENNGHMVAPQKAGVGAAGTG